MIDRLLLNLSELKPCGHDTEGFALWISLRSKELLCGLCYQVTQKLAEAICCTACGEEAADPQRNTVVLVKVADWLGAHFWLCARCGKHDRGAARRN